MRRFQHLGVSPATRKLYGVAVRQFLAFCETHKLQPLPASSLTLRLFCTHLSSRAQHKSIRAYLAGIRLWHIENEVEHKCGDPLLQLLCSGIKREQGVSTSDTQHPITADVLARLFEGIENSSWSDWDKDMFQATMSLAFHGFLRSNEFVSPTQTTWNPAINLSPKDIKVSDSQLLVTIKSSKTDPFRKGQQIALGASHTKVCPIRSMRRYWQHRRKIPHNLPLFVLDNGGFLTREKLASTLKELLQELGMEASHFSTHSFRIGATTTAARIGIPDSLIQQLGRWSSDAYRRYIRPSEEEVGRMRANISGKSAREEE